MKVTILGCGTSSGVPRIGGADGSGDWGACDPADPRNRRRRAAILVEHADVTLVVDAGPDFREQMLASRVGRIDALILTHDHADHCHGIDDLRQFFHASGQPVTCYASAATWAVVKPRFNYIFAGTAHYPPTATAHELPSAAFTIGDITVRAFDQTHGSIISTGLRFDAGGLSLAYSTDVNDLPTTARQLVKGVDVWIVDALRARPHPTHSHLEQTLAWISEARPRLAILTHMDQSLDYAALAAALPPSVVPGHDGLIVDLSANFT